MPGDQQLFPGRRRPRPRPRRQPWSCWPTAPRRRRARATRSRTGVVTSRVLPSLYRDAEVHRLAPFFRTCAAALQDGRPRRRRRSPHRGAHARPVRARPPSSTPSSRPTSATRSSRAATSWSATGRVWLRSLGRLEPVDVVLRRVDAWFCDPLELRPDSQLGVPGLVEACRLGTVSVVNPLGSGVLENPALLALPAGDRRAAARPGAAAAVGADVVVRRRRRPPPRARQPRPAGAQARRPARPGRRRRASAWLLTRRRARRAARAGSRPGPSRGSGQETVDLGSTPTLTGGRPRAAALRAAHLRRAPGRPLRGHARRAHPGRADRRRARRRVEPGRRASARTPGCWPSEPEQLGGLLAASRPAGAGGRAGGVDVVPGGREPVLARPLRRAGRGRRPAAAGRARPAQRVRPRHQPGRHRVPRGAARRPHRTSPRRYPGFVGDGRGRALADPATSSRRWSSTTTAPGHPGPRRAPACSTPPTPCATSSRATPGSWSATSTATCVARHVRPPPSAGPPSAGCMRSLLALSGLASEHGARPRLAVHGRRPAHRAGACSWPRCCARDWSRASAARHRQPAARVGARSRPRASSPTAAATGPRPSPRPCSTCCCSTPENPRSLAYQVDRLVEDVGALPGGRPRGQLSRRRPARRSRPRPALRLADTARAGPRRRRRPAGRPRGLPRRRPPRRSPAADAVDAAHFTHLLPNAGAPWPTSPTPADAVDGRCSCMTPTGSRTPPSTGTSRRCRRATASSTCCRATPTGSVPARPRSYIDPPPHDHRERTDFFGNRASYFAVLAAPVPRS